MKKLQLRVLAATVGFATAVALANAPTAYADPGAPGRGPSGATAMPTLSERRSERRRPGVPVELLKAVPVSSRAGTGTTVGPARTAATAPGAHHAAGRGCAGDRRRAAGQPGGPAGGAGADGDHRQSLAWYNDAKAAFAQLPED